MPATRAASHKVLKWISTVYTLVDDGVEDKCDRGADACQRLGTSLALDFHHLPLPSPSSTTAHDKTSASTSPCILAFSRQALIFALCLDIVRYSAKSPRPLTLSFSMTS
ncbi:hypothetical protein B0H11DRAFT_2220243 [Mycena galericulata]|nr:hypothetical protein B0H11DRAFT_2220243 [Mycena galericulata]